MSSLNQFTPDILPLTTQNLDEAMPIINGNFQRTFTSIQQFAPSTFDSGGKANIYVPDGGMGHNTFGFFPWIKELSNANFDRSQLLATPSMDLYIDCPDWTNPTDDHLWPFGSAISSFAQKIYISTIINATPDPSAFSAPAPGAKRYMSFMVLTYNGDTVIHNFGYVANISIFGSPQSVYR